MLVKLPKITQRDLYRTMLTHLAVHQTDFCVFMIRIISFHAGAPA